MMDRLDVLWYLFMAQVVVGFVGLILFIGYMIYYHCYGR